VHRRVKPVLRPGDYRRRDRHGSREVPVHGSTTGPGSRRPLIVATRGGRACRACASTLDRRPMTLQEFFRYAKESARPTKCAFARNAPSRGLSDTLRGSVVAEVGEFAAGRWRSDAFGRYRA
jgi:hypothetical protein